MSEPKSYTLDVTIDLGAGTVTGTITPDVAPPEPHDPLVIRADEWTARPDTGRDEPGHRRVDVEGDVPVPTGHLLKLYSGPDPTATATKGSATVTPGVPYLTKNPMAVGETCHNALWWLRQDDGTMLPASENVIVFAITGD